MGSFCPLIALVVLLIGICGVFAALNGHRHHEVVEDRDN